MRSLLKIFLIVSIYSCLTNYSYSKINELEILISSSHCAQKSIDNQKPEIKFLGDARLLINFYKQQGNFLQLISFLDSITFCYRALDEKNKKFYLDKHFEDIEFLISNENLINFKDKIEENNYYKLLGLYLFDQATSKDYEKKIPFL